MPPAKRPAKAASARKKPTSADAARKAKARTPARSAGSSDGAAAVRALIAGERAEHRAILRAVDRIVARNVPGVRRAVKWSMPVYGVPGNGWFLATAAFKEHVRVSFFRGARIEPPPPLGESKDMRSARYQTRADVDEAQLAHWVRQAASIQGWGKA